MFETRPDVVTRLDVVTIPHRHQGASHGRNIEEDGQALKFELRNPCRRALQLHPERLSLGVATRWRRRNACCGGSSHVDFESPHARSKADALGGGESLWAV